MPGGSQGLDRYAYTNNNPLRYTDPTGHYGVDVHSSLTFNLVWKAAFQVAIEKGYSADKASELAGRLAMRISSADQHVDRTEGEENALNKPKGGFEEAAHHWHTTSQAESELMSTVDGTPEEFGEALHAYQDSFSHWQKLGEPDTPGEIWDRHKTNQFDSFKCVIASKCIDHFDPTQDTAWGWIDAAMERGTENYINWYMYSAIPDRDRRPADPRSPAEIQ